MKTTGCHISTQRLIFCVLAARKQVVEGEQRRGRKVMVFCNTLDSCRATEHALQEGGLPTRSYHGDVPLDGRAAAIADFCGDQGAASEEQPILVCTDLAARCASKL